MWNISRRNLFITLVFFVWLGAAAAVCGVFSIYQHPINSDEMMLSAPADAAVVAPATPVMPVALKTIR